MSQHSTAALRADRVPTAHAPLPVDWGVSSVGDEFSVELGKMIDAAKNTGVERPYIGNRSVQWGRIELSELETVRLTPTDLQRFRLRLGDLLVCEGGEVGRGAIWDDPIPECYYQKALHRLRPRRSYNVRLMLAFLEYWSSTGALSNFVTQTSIAHLPKDKFETVPLPVPTPGEQRAIADALTDVDAWLQSLDALIEKKRAVKQATMQQLLGGIVRLPGFRGPWIDVALGRLGTFLKGNGVSRSMSRSGDIPCVRYGEIYTSHHNVIRDFESWISREVAGAATRVVRGDILFAASGETKAEIGKSVAFVDDFEAYAGGDIVILRTSGVSATFLGYALNMPSVVRQKASRGQGDAVVHIGSTALSRIQVSLPDLMEQEAIAEVLLDLDRELLQLLKHRSKVQQIKQAMLQQLLTGRIRLVPSE